MYLHGNCLFYHAPPPGTKYKTDLDTVPVPPQNITFFRRILPFAIHIFSKSQSQLGKLVSFHVRNTSCFLLALHYISSNFLFHKKRGSFLSIASFFAFNHYSIMKNHLFYLSTVSCGMTIEK